MKVRESGMPEEAVWAGFFNPECILRELECLRPIGNIVEFGCGYGTFTIPAARNSNGTVFALDIEPAMIDLVMRKSKADSHSNIMGIVRDFVANGSGLENAIAGYAMLFNLLHLEEPVSLLREARRVLAPGGKAGIIHWRTDIETPRGPSLSIRPSIVQCRDWAEQAGFEFLREMQFESSPWHWGVLLRKPCADSL